MWICFSIQHHIVLKKRRPVTPVLVFTTAAVCQAQTDRHTRVRAPRFTLGHSARASYVGVMYLDMDFVRMGHCARTNMEVRHFGHGILTSVHFGHDKLTGVHFGHGKLMLVHFGHGRLTKFFNDIGQQCTHTMTL